MQQFSPKHLFSNFIFIFDIIYSFHNNIFSSILWSASQWAQPFIPEFLIILFFTLFLYLSSTMRIFMDTIFIVFHWSIQDRYSVYSCFAHGNLWGHNLLTHFELLIFAFSAHEMYAWLFSTLSLHFRLKIKLESQNWNVFNSTFSWSWVHF